MIRELKEMSALLYSAPNEKYLDHISRCKDKFDLVFPVFYSTIVRTFDTSVDQEMFKRVFSKDDFFFMTLESLQRSGKRL